MWCHAVWSPRVLACALPLAAVTVAEVVIDGLGHVEGLGLVAGLHAVAAVALVLHARVLVLIDSRRVTVLQPFLQRALLTVPLRHITQASSEPRVPGAFRRGDYGVVAAGPVFGYRSRATGPALRLHLADGRTCVLTVDDAATAAALVNAHLDRQRTPAAG
jgi:hypothetical protein